MDTLGAFELGPVIGKGAFAHVRRGRHRGTQLPVAIKVFDRRQPDPAGFEAGLRVQASLVHRDVLMVLDGGLAVEGDALPLGTPYMVLEWASGGSAAEATFTCWEDVRRVLTTTLSGLARAHAAGLVHRDVKLPNLLRCTPADLRPGFKLADFGIAVAQGASAPRAGTPVTMAPEQILGLAHEIGPWTDLYAVGCIAFQLVTGRPPVPLANLDVALDAHLRGLTVPFVPRFPVPPGLAEWIAELRQVDPFHRPDRAMVALAALDGMEGAGLVDGSVPVEDEIANLETVRLDSLSFQVPDRLLGGGWRRAATTGPLRWQDPHISVPRALLATGARLARLRRGQPFGRSAAQQALWTALAVPDGVSRLTWLRGPSGVGRSHLLHWLGQRAHELAQADVLVLEGDWLRAALGFPPEDDLGVFLARSLPGTPEPRRHDLAWLLDARPRPGNTLRRFAEARAGRPLLVLVDDAPGRLDALEQVRGLLEGHRTDGPGVRVVATASDDEPLGPWGGLPADVVRLEPMSAAELESALVERLGLSVAEATRAVADAGGMPRDAFDAAMVAQPATRRGSARLLRRLPHAERMLAVASILQGDGLVDVAAWFEHVGRWDPEGVEELSPLVDQLLDGGFAHVVGPHLRIDPALLARVEVPADVLEAVASQLAPPSRVRALARHGLPRRALEEALAWSRSYGVDTDARFLDGLERAAELLGEEGAARARLLAARIYSARGDLAAAEDRVERAALALSASEEGRIEVEQVRMHRALHRGDYGEVMARFDAHRAALARHEPLAAMSYLIVALIPPESPVGMERAEAALRAEELASKHGLRTVKVEARRLLAELSMATTRRRPTRGAADRDPTGPHDDLPTVQDAQSWEQVDAWIRAARRAARGAPCMPLFGVILAEARFAVRVGDVDRARACLDELARMPAAPARPMALGALQRAELCVVEGDWEGLGPAADEAQRRARDVDWHVVGHAAEALAAGFHGEQRRWDAAERSVDAAGEAARHGGRLEAIAASMEHLAEKAEAFGLDALTARARALANMHRGGR